MFRLTDLKHRYGDESVLDIRELEGDQGQHQLILGPSGCGKTTLLHIMGGIRRPTSGQVIVAGEDLNTLSGNSLDRFRGRHIGIIFQRLHLMSTLTVEGNLLMAPYLAGLPQQRDRIREVLDSLDMSDKASAFPHQLSQGQRQRVAIARAVMNQPSVLLADEPTASLDDTRAEQVLSLLVGQARANNSTLVVATHDKRIVSQFDHQLVLDTQRRVVA